MEIEIHETWNPKALEKFMLGARMKEALVKVNNTLGYVRELQPSIIDEYVKSIVIRLKDEIEGYSVNSALLSKPELMLNLEHLEKYPGLRVAVFQFTSFHLNLRQDRRPVDEEIDVYSLDNAKAYERLSYYLTKATIDVLGKKDGISLWKKMVGLRLRKENEDYEKELKKKIDNNEPLSTMQETNDGAMKRWNRIGLGNYVIAKLDENKTLFRFDKCHTHEALKDLNDPDIAYLASCYVGDHPSYNIGRKFLRRTQTLHHGAFCDELYWMTDVHDNPEQPSLDFTKNLGKGE